MQVLALFGPTAVGKTGVAIAVAERRAARKGVELIGAARRHEARAQEILRGATALERLFRLLGAFLGHHVVFVVARLFADLLPRFPARESRELRIKACSVDFRHRVRRPALPLTSVVSRAILRHCVWSSWPLGFPGLTRAARATARAGGRTERGRITSSMKPSSAPL